MSGIILTLLCKQRTVKVNLSLLCLPSNCSELFCQYTDFWVWQRYYSDVLPQANVYRFLSSQYKGSFGWEMNTLLLGNLYWPDFLREGLDPLSWSEKEKKVKQRYVECDVKVCFCKTHLLNSFLCFIHFLNSQHQLLKKRNPLLNVFVTAVVSDNFTEAIWAIAGIMRDCGLWWERSGEVKTEWCSWNKHRHPPWSVMVSLGFFSYGLQARGLGTGVVDGQDTDFWPSFTVKPWHRQGLTNRVGQEWYHGSDISLWQQRLISGVRYTLVLHSRAIIIY